MPRKVALNSAKKAAVNGKPKASAVDEKTGPKRRKNSKPSYSIHAASSGSSEESDTDTAIAVSKPMRDVKYFAEQCILSNSKAKPKTSDHTLSSLKEKIDFSTLHLLAKSKVESHVKEREHTFRKHQLYMDKWLLLIQEGFNVMLYGVGSKLSLLDRFVQERLKEKDTIVIHGFFPALNVKQILNSIVEDVIGQQTTFSSLHSQAEYIKENLHSDLFLIVHNMDSPTLSAERTLTVLCQLAKCNKIHYVATVDHVNSGLIWNSSCAASFKFVWFDVTNFTSYHRENAYENSFLARQNNSLALSSLLHVFCSLTPNAQGIYLLLGRAQLDQDDHQKNGMQFKELFRLCREAFLVNSEQTLQTQLTEFKDHNMVRLRKAQDGLEYLHIPVDKQTLKEFVDMQH